MNRAAVVVIALLMAGCAARRPAPVVERTVPSAPPVVEAAEPAPEPPPPEKPIPTHVVKRGETLASIALQHGVDYRELAAWNNIVNPNRIEIGQVLALAAPAGMPPLAAPVITPLVTAATPIESRPLSNTPNAKVEPRATKVPFSERALAQMGVTEAAGPPVSGPPPVVESSTAPPEPERSPGTDAEEVDWMWPVKGKVLTYFTEASKGVDIGGRKGAPVLAAASGRVIYAGSNIRGYGKLIIIRHNNTWLSAYAHNDNLLVQEQQDVRKGQKIAEMGSTDADQVKLHFEVRRQSRPVDPVKILPAM